MGFGIGNFPIGRVSIGGGRRLSRAPFGRGWYPCCCPPPGDGSSGLSGSASTFQPGFDCWSASLGPVPAFFQVEAALCAPFGGTFILSQCRDAFPTPGGHLPPCTVRSGFIFGHYCTWQSVEIPFTEAPFAAHNYFAFIINFSTTQIDVDLRNNPGGGNPAADAYYRASWAYADGWMFAPKTLHLLGVAGDFPCETVPDTITLSPVV